MRVGGLTMTLQSKKTAVLLLATLGIGACAFSCGSREQSHESGTVAIAVSAKTGESLFKSKCANCHRINGTGGRKAPDLSRTGAEAEHTAKWLAEFIRNPKSKDQISRMPGFEGKISEGDLQAICEYLVSLK